MIDMDKYDSLIDLNYEVNRPMDDDNKIYQIIKTRAQIVNDPNYKIDRFAFWTLFGSLPFVWQRTPGITEVETSLRDGVLWYHTPMTNADENRGKEGSRFILHNETASVGYWIPSDKIKKAVEFVDNPENDKTTEEFYWASKVVQNTVHGQYNALLKMLKPKTDKTVEIVNNDVTIDGKKFIGIDEHLHESGVYTAAGLNYFYNDDFFKKCLTGDEYHRKTGAGLTGIVNEIPGITKLEVLEEWHAIVRAQIEEVIEYL